MENKTKLDLLFEQQMVDLKRSNEEALNQLNYFYLFCKDRGIDQESVGSIFLVNGKRAMLTFFSTFFRKLTFAPMSPLDDIGTGTFGGRITIRSFDDVKHEIAKIH